MNMSMNMKKAKNEKEKKSIFSIFKKSDNIKSKKENKINKQEDENVISNGDNIVDINDSSTSIKISYENEDMLRFIQNYDKKKSMDSIKNQENSDQNHFSEDDMDRFFEEVDEGIYETVSDDELLDEIENDGANLSTLENEEESGFVEDDEIYVQEDITQEDDETYVKEDIAKEDDELYENSYDLSEEEYLKNISGDVNYEDESLFNLSYNEISDAVKEKETAVSDDLNLDSLDLNDSEIYEDLNLDEYFEKNDSLEEDGIDFSVLENEETIDFDKLTYVSENSEDDFSKVLSDYDKSIEKDEVEDNYKNFIDFEPIVVSNLENEEKSGENQEKSKFTEIDEEKRRRIKENKKRKKERKKAKIRKYIEEAKRLEREAISNSNDEIKDFEEIPQTQNTNSQIKSEQFIIEEVETKADIEDNLVEEVETKTYEENKQTIVKEVDVNDIKSGKVLKLQEYLAPVQLPRAREVVKIEVIVRTEGIETNSNTQRENLIDADDSMRESADYSNYKVNVGINTALNYYNKNDKEKSLKFLKDIAICSYNNKEYMIAYLAIKEIFSNGSKSQYIEILREVTQAKERQKIEIERLLETINSEAMEDILQRQKAELERFLDTLNSEMDRLI